MARRPGLGKGLEALIPTGLDELTQPQAEKGITLLPVEKIRPNPHQPRGPINPADLEELAASIKIHGVIQPIIVTRDEGQESYILVAGERRWRAAQAAGLTEIPAIVRTTSQQQMLELALIENLQREDLNPLERANAYQQLCNNFSFTHDDIARQVGKSRVSVTNTLRLLNLSDDAKSALLDGKISEGHARTLLSLNSTRAQDAALATILNLGLNVRQTELLTSKLSGKKPQGEISREKSPQVRSLEDRLRTLLKTRVNLKEGKNGGSITIFYYSDEELNDLMERLSSLE